MHLLGSDGGRIGSSLGYDHTSWAFNGNDS